MPLSVLCSLQSYFCGQNPVCVRFGSKQALLLAKRNVDLHYTVVGIVEKMQVTVEVMERLLPSVFASGLKWVHDSIHDIGGEPILFEKTLCDNVTQLNFSAHQEQGYLLNKAQSFL